MIVEDHAEMRRMLNNIVTRTFDEPLEVIECGDGSESVKAYQIHHPDCVLMDLQLKNMNGFQAIEKIYEQDAKAKVIIVTSFDTPLFRQKARELHTKGFVCKDELSNLNQLLHNISTK